MWKSFFDKPLYTLVFVRQVQEGMLVREKKNNSKRNNRELLHTIGKKVVVPCNLEESEVVEGKMSQRALDLGKCLTIGG